MPGKMGEESRKKAVQVASVKKLTGDKEERRKEAKEKENAEKKKLTGYTLFVKSVSKGWQEMGEDLGDNALQEIAEMWKSMEASGKKA